MSLKFQKYSWSHKKYRPYAKLAVWFRLIQQAVQNFLNGAGRSCARRWRHQRLIIWGLKSSSFASSSILCGFKRRDILYCSSKVTFDDGGAGIDFLIFNFTPNESRKILKKIGKILTQHMTKFTTKCSHFSIPYLRTSSTSASGIDHHKSLTSAYFCDWDDVMSAHVTLGGSQN